MNEIYVLITTPTKLLYKYKVKHLSVPTLGGQIQILPSHSPMVTMLDTGEIKLTESQECVKIIINGGVLNVSENEVTILVNEAYKPEEVINKEITEAIEKAKKKLSSTLNPSELIQLEKQIRFEKFKKRYVNEGM